MAAVGHFGCPKFTLDHISGHFRSIQICYYFRSHFYPFHIDTQLYFFFEIFDKMADVDHFGCPNFTFDRISGHFRSIQILYFFLIFQNGCRWPFWMSENHFRSHFYPFHIDTQLYLTKWLTSAILDVRISLSIAFLAISDRYATLFFLFFFGQNGWRQPFGCPKFTFNCISGHFRSICNFNFVLKFLTKWLPAAILDVRNSLSIAILAISDRYRIFFSGGHFGCLKVTLDRISGHFRLIGHFGCPKFTSDVISGHFRSIRTTRRRLCCWRKHNIPENVSREYNDMLSYTSGHSRLNAVGHEIHIWNIESTLALEIAMRFIAWIYKWRFCYILDTRLSTNGHYNGQCNTIFHPNSTAERRSWDTSHLTRP